MTKGAPKLYTHQFIDRQGQIVPPANVAEETDVTDIMVELAFANDDMELRRVAAHNLELWLYAVRSRLFKENGGTDRTGELELCYTGCQNAGYEKFCAGDIEKTGNTSGSSGSRFNWWHIDGTGIQTIITDMCHKQAAGKSDNYWIY